ncbi:hypothetical protein H5410_007885 [Solanum commersonii]|uniref:SKP1-like protein n=1 Tax=Solanum commersonii TaxID=4109 RepID=A0A9J6AE66_SOLCO|nr:hypothetical protein H5410_007885 [Solanum commersonii]
MSSEKLIAFKTSDGEEFKLNEAVAVRSEVIKNMVQNVDCTSNVIPLSNVDGNAMTKVVQYWKKYSEEGATEDQLKIFDQDFLKMSQSELLKEVIIQEFVDRIKGKPMEEICEVFGIVNNYTLE